jgi:hypothetical protein
MMRGERAWAIANPAIQQQARKVPAHPPRHAAGMNDLRLGENQTSPWGNCQAASAIVNTMHAASAAISHRAYLTAQEHVSLLRIAGASDSSPAANGRPRMVIGSPVPSLLTEKNGLDVNPEVS